ncbi:hypothetical protein BDF14DRAFT_1750111 [Spinellus fusiger]|nr:hypothetical protein BDF14DRAFT_1750111 [Spinellus fusiger]
MAHFLVLLLTGYLGIHQCLYALYVPIHASDLSVALRTQRDIGQDITLDQYLWPALNLTSAYFGTDFSNTHLNSMSYLLDYGYLRFGIDVYWNDITSRWQICPEAGLDESIATDQRIHQSLCSPSGLKYFLGVINSHLCQTELLVSPMNTHLLVLILNLHTVGAQDATKDPMTRIDTLTSLLVSGISHTPRQNSRFYTPVDLMQSQREMGDGTGNGTGNGTGDRDGTGVVWPSWMHVVRQHKQLLVGFGSVSTLFNNITTLQDHPLIFRSGMLGTNVEFPLEEAFVTDACPSQNSTVGWSLWSDENEAWNATQVQQIVRPP